MARRNRARKNVAITMTNEHAICPREDLGIERVDGDVVILDRQNQKIHQLNESASAIWSSLEKGCDAEQIAREIVDVFDISFACALKDVTQTLTDFRELNLLR